MLLGVLYLRLRCMRIIVFISDEKLPVLAESETDMVLLMVGLYGFDRAECETMLGGNTESIVYNRCDTNAGETVPGISFGGIMAMVIGC